MENKDKLLEFLDEIEKLAESHSVIMERHELRHRGQEWHMLVKFRFPKIISLNVQSGKHVGVSRFGQQQ